ncbi:cytochrome P450 [Mycena rebaudengoi]|nr:cytochrome P450 [Mycena rebaudengoi]
MILQLLLPLVGTLLCYALFHFIQMIYRDLTSPLRDMVGPKNPSWILGNFKEMADDAFLTDKWRAQFGPNFQFKGLFNIRELHTSDTKAINHIVTNSVIYQKAPIALHSSRRFLGSGILSTIGDEHKRQVRCIQTPAFGMAQIRDMTELFVEKAVQLRDVWARQMPKETDSACIDVLSWLRKMTLDVIGQAGFDYQFNALEPKGAPNKLNQVFTELLHSPTAQRDAGFRLAQSIIPILRILPTPGHKVFNTARTMISKIGNQLLTDGKAAVEAAGGEKTVSGRRDLLSLLLKANMATDIPEHQRLSDAEVVAQVPAFFIAGHETTSSATSWTLYALAVNRSAQTKLREELLSVSTDNPTMEELNALPYLEAVVRETMRVHSPVVFTTRMAMADDVLPLNKPYIDKQGVLHDSLTIAKGQMIHIPILAVNTDKTIWGADASEFRPERWEHVPDAVNEIPGVWAHLLTFFAGPHNCIGFRFTLVEQKALLFTLIRAFEFEMSVPKGGIGRSSTPLQRPVVLAEREKGSQLPLIVKLYRGF